ncbi:MAG: efflux RND transporter permease subunit, partial [Methylococcales bacterium]|nr:efflux RND transporter permease subunit [Methylococcales bacterium]
QDWFLKYELQAVPGVSEVATIGGMVRQYQVVIDPQKLRSFKISLQKIKMAIIKSNQEVGGSVIEMGEAEYMVRSTGYLTKIDDLKTIPLGFNSSGTPILLDDVADIRVGPQMRRGLAELDGEGEVVGGIVVMRWGENAQQTIERVKTKLENLKQSLPEGVEIVETYNRSSLIDRAITHLRDKLFEEFIVVLLVCIVFLFHFRSSLVILISLPVGILSAFIIMKFQGINANIMSLGGIAIAIGVMVDAAIVMVENAHKNIEKHKADKDYDHWKIIKQSAGEVGPALFFSLLITTLSFMPVFTLEAQEGKLFSPLAFTKTYAMAASALLAITLVPVLMGYFVRGNIIPEHKNPINKGLMLLYRPFIKGVVNWPKTVLLFALMIVVVGFWPLNKLGSEFMPDLNEGDLMYMPTTFPGISIGKARELLQQTDKLIKTHPEVKSVFGKIGRAETATDPAPLTMIETLIQLKPKNQWRAGVTIDQIKSELNQLIQFPGVTNAWVMPIKTRIDMLATGIKTPLGLKIAGQDLAIIQKIGAKLETIIQSIPGTASVFSEKVAGGRYVTVNINRLNAARFGLNITDVQEVVKTAIGGMNVTQTVEGLERYPVNIRYPREIRDSLQELKMLPIITPQGAQIPLEEVAKISIEEGPPMIKSENARLNGWIFVDIEGRDLGSYVAEAQKVVAGKIKLPPGYSIAWSGQYEYMIRAKQKLMIVIPITLFIIMILLYLNFRNVMEVAIIMGTLPCAMIGGIWLLYIMNFNLSVAVGVGFIALAGVSVEIGVIMLIYLDQSLKEQQQIAKNEHRLLTFEQIKQAVVNGVLLRVRPIMMTVSATIAGLIPILYGTGTGAEVMQRIAAPMLGGMVSAIFLTLLVLPAVYLIWKKWTIELSEV